MALTRSNDNQTNEAFKTALEACLNALYPNRASWGNKPKANATGVKEIHLLLSGQADYLGSHRIKQIYDIAKKRLDKTSCCSCWPCHFGKRDPFVESLYSALDNLNAGHKLLANPVNIQRATTALNALLIRINERNTATLAIAATPTEHNALIK